MRMEPSRTGKIYGSKLPYGGLCRYAAAAAAVTAAVGILLLSTPQPARAQFEFFGRNKVQYDRFQWKTLNTPHFVIHYYEGVEEAVHDAARIAERSYAYLSQILQVDMKQRIPVLLYADHQDFRQTNAVVGIGEGTQGVTESLKQRVILPMMPTMEEFTHIFTHELVHAFQMEIMGTGNSLNPLQWQPPLWIMEGMAEYFSIGLDPNTEIWLRDMVQRDEFMSLTEFETVRDIRVYRLGQGLYDFLGERYGKESLRRFFKETVRTRNWAAALQRVYSQSPKELSEQWKSHLKAKYGTVIAEQDSPDSIAMRLVEHKGLIYNLNLTPSISPDGKKIAFIANADLRDAIYIVDAETGDSRRALAYGGSSGSLEIIDFFESTMSWSADGEILAFVGSGGTEDVIHLVDSRTGKTRKKLRFEGVSITSAALSPDGSRVVFSGMKNGQRDLYIATIESGELRRLTEDTYSYIHPSWSPDGSTIAVTTDCGAPTDAENLDFRGYRLALVDPGTGSVEILTGGSYHDINPVWSPDGEELAFVSDRAGVPQIFLYNLTRREIRKVTNLISGVSGITASSPAISWSLESGRMAFSSFRSMGWDIYTMPDPRNITLSEAASRPDPGTAPFEPVWAGYELGDPALFEEAEYLTRIKADYVFGAGGFSTNVGVMGDFIVGFSDMLGNHNLTLGIGMYGSLSRSNISVTYVNLTRRLNWGISIFQEAMMSGLWSSLAGTKYWSRTYRGAALMGYYPFNTFSRLEGNVGVINIEDELLTASWYGRISVDEELGSDTFTQAGLSHVYDSALYFISGPIGGQRWRAQVYSLFGKYSSTTLILDYRKYLTINHRGALALRTFAGGTVSGLGQRLFRIGGPTTLHGTNWGQMSGANVAIQNVELRYPLMPWMPIQWDFLSGALFADAGAVWEKGTRPEWLPVDYPVDEYILNGIVGAMGGGVRVNLGFLTLFFDYAIPTDFRGNYGAGRLQFAIGQIF
jgi:Tol biopolymer transport system component